MSQSWMEDGSPAVLQHLLQLSEDDYLTTSEAIKQCLDIIRVLDKVRRGSNEYDCWEWTGSKEKTWGYGRIQWRGDVQFASKAMLEIKLGRPLQSGMLACHTCDNPPCSNPKHLYEGTPLQNIQDMMERGRRKQGSMPKGEDHHKAKLSWEAVREIRRMYATGDYSWKELGKLFGVTKRSIGYIVQGRTWREQQDDEVAA